MITKVGAHSDPVGLSPLALYAMGGVADRGSATPSDVAEALIVRDGLISRRSHPGHRGKSLLALTDTGRALVDDAYERLRAADRNLDQELGGH